MTGAEPPVSESQHGSDPQARQTGNYEAIAKQGIARDTVTPQA